MLVASRTRRLALHIPVLSTALCGLVCPGAVILASAGWSWRAVGVTAVAALLLLATVSQYRWIRARPGRLRVTNVFGTITAVLARTAIGIRIRRSYRRMPRYIVYALEGSREIELADFGGARRAERMRQVLREMLFSPSTPEAEAALAVVRDREEAWKRQEAEAEQAVEAVYGRGGVARVGMWSAALFTICLFAAVIIAVVSRSG